MYIWSLIAKGPWVVMLLIGNRFYLQSHYDLDHWPLDQNIKGGHQLAKTNASMQFEGQGYMGCEVIDRKSLIPTNLMWPLPLTPWPKKSIVIIYWPSPMHTWSLSVKGLWVVKLLIGSNFYLQDGLDLFYLDPKINSGHVLANNNFNTEFEAPRLTRSSFINRKSFLLWHLTL
jgi:hypothetical protein